MQRMYNSEDRSQKLDPQANCNSVEVMRLEKVKHVVAFQTRCKWVLDREGYYCFGKHQIVESADPNFFSSCSSQEFSLNNEHEICYSAAQMLLEVAGQKLQAVRLNWYPYIKFEEHFLNH